MCIRDRPNAAIIIDKKPNVSSACAAMELQYHFKKMTGAIIPILNAPETKYPVNILVGESPHTKKLGYKNEDFKHQEYGLFFKKNNIIIIGKDIDKPYTDKLLTFVGEEEKAIPGPGIYDEQGTLYATYDFLEKYCGVRWYGPKEIQIIFPKTKNLTVTSKDIKRKPRFIWRVLSNPEIEGIAGWIVGTRMWDHPPKDLVQQYGRRLKSGGYSYYANHSLEAYYDRFSKKYKKHGKVVGEKNQYFERHEPNFFIKEKNDNIPSFSIDYHHQLNFLYKGVEDQVVKDAEGYFERGVVPVGSHGKGNYYSVIPNDNWHFDGLNDGTYVNEDYPEITAYKTDHGRIVPPWNEETASRINNEVGTGEWSDYWFTFINKVAGRIKKKYPDKYIATLAYGRYALYPQNVKVADNVSIQLCLRVRNWFDPFVKKRSLEILSDWCNRGEDRPIYLWLYYCWPSEELGAKFKFEPFPPFYPRIQAKQIKLYDRLKNIRGAFVNG
ncbi:MAG: DUF4838 domain-containing protein, partial [Alphaproteobacteria bacterium]|nr:DUF4838 domain-containing protein [Alphaproteobacteria bacterium]